MCFASSPPQECPSEDVSDPFIIDEDRLVIGFTNIHLEPVEPAPQGEDQQSLEFEITPYDISNAPAAYLDTISNFSQFDAPGQFDEMNPQYFIDELSNDYYSQS